MICIWSWMNQTHKSGTSSLKRKQAASLLFETGLWKWCDITLVLTKQLHLHLWACSHQNQLPSCLVLSCGFLPESFCYFSLFMCFYFVLIFSSSKSCFELPLIKSCIGVVFLPATQLYMTRPLSRQLAFIAHLSHGILKLCQHLWTSYVPPTIRNSFSHMAGRSILLCKLLQSGNTITMIGTVCRSVSVSSITGTWRSGPPWFPSKTLSRSWHFLWWPCWFTSRPSLRYFS